MYGTIFLLAILGMLVFDEKYYVKQGCQVVLLLVVTRFLVKLTLHRRLWAKLV